VRGGFIRYRDEAVPDVEGGRLRRRRPEPDDAEECFRPAEQVPDERGTYAATTFRRADVEMPQPSDLVVVRERIFGVLLPLWIVLCGLCPIRSSRCANRSERGLGNFSSLGTRRTSRPGCGRYAACWSGKSKPFVAPGLDQPSTITLRQAQSKKASPSRLRRIYGVQFPPSL
jgi:hypothetical protein